MTRRSLLAALCGLPALLGTKHQSPTVVESEYPVPFPSIDGQSCRLVPPDRGDIVPYIDSTDGRRVIRYAVVTRPYRSALA